MEYIKNVVNKEIVKRKNINIFRLFLILLLDPSKDAIFTFRIAQYLNCKGHKKVAKLLSLRLVKKYGLFISLKSKIGMGLEFRHVNGVVIGEGVTLGENSIIYQQVTIGGQNIGDAKLGKYPQIGDNVTIFAGAKLLGDIIIGDNSIIGANSVVIKNVEANSIYAGIPAKKIKTIQSDMMKENY